MTAEPQPFDWPAALDAFGIGYTLDACRRVRDLLDAAGVPQPPLYHLELDQVTELRRQATARTKQADAIEQRAPRSTVNPVNSYADVRVKPRMHGGELECKADGCRWQTIVDDVDTDGLVWFSLAGVVKAATYPCPYPGERS